MTDHDGGYKTLFSHKRMMADLLRGFIHEPWVDQLDLDSLERCEGSYVSAKFRRFEQDMVWRVRWQGQPEAGEDEETSGSWLYVYLLLEFQSQVERFMGVRVLTYLSLFYQDLVRQGELTPSGKLPPVLPVVLYNGRERWWAPRQVASLIEQIPGGLSAYQPRLEYLLLDEGEYSEAELASLHNLVAALFRLEQSQDAEAVHKVVDTLVDWLREPGHRGLRRAFSRWLREVLLPARVPDTEIPRIRDLEDARAMLRERVIEWTQEWRQEGRQEGRLEGRREGERHLLVQQLEHRFGTLDDSTRSRIERASDERLITWGKRLLSAERLEDVFA